MSKVNFPDGGWLEMDETGNLSACGKLAHDIYWKFKKIERKFGKEQTVNIIKEGFIQAALEHNINNVINPVEAVKTHAKEYLSYYEKKI
jgi:hypothetical protein